MSRVKKIYFLLTFVLIIGCLTLNKSYSLFVQTEERDFVDVSVPNLDGELSLNSIEIESGKEYLVKQTVSNLGGADMNYAINVSSTSNDYKVKAVSDGENNYFSTGMLSSNTFKDLYFVVSNTGNDTITVNFTLDKKYTTLNNDLETNIDNTNIYNISVGIPYQNNKSSLSYKIIEQYINSSLYSGIVVEKLSDLFENETIKVELPISSEFEIENPVFNGVAKEELGLFQAEDDYGTSYYYRGASSVNYVNFAGFTWRIVRINGDGSVRLILDGTLDKVIHKDETQAVYLNSKLAALSNGAVLFNTQHSNNALVGYMYGDLNGTTFDTTHKNEVSSTVKIYIDTFYKEYLISYQEYIADTLFCGDKTGGGSASSTTINFGAYKRLSYSSSVTPTLECAKGVSNTYSRYTANSTTTTKGVNVNNDLDYPIALLSADELVMAGAYGKTLNEPNDDYYLADGYNYKTPTLSGSWWTMSPYRFSDGYATLYYSSSNSSLSYKYASSNYLVRPVINLKSTVEVKEGNGTYDMPYEIKEIS